MRDVGGSRQLGEPLRHLVVERELPVFLKQQDRRGGELLAHRADRVAHLGARRRAGRDPADPVRVFVDDLAAPHDRDRRARRTGRLEHGFHAGVDRGAVRGY